MVSLTLHAQERIRERFPDASISELETHAELAISMGKVSRARDDTCKHYKFMGAVFVVDDTGPVPTVITVYSRGRKC